MSGRLAAPSSPHPTLLGSFFFVFSRIFLALLLYLFSMNLSFQVNLHIKYQSFSLGFLLLFPCYIDISNQNIFSGLQRRHFFLILWNRYNVPFKPVGEAGFHQAHSPQGVRGSGYLHPLVSPELIISEFSTSATVPVSNVFISFLFLFAFIQPFGCKTLYFLKISFQKLVVILEAPKLFPEAPDTINVSNYMVKKRLLMGSHCASPSIQSLTIDPRDSAKKPSL